MVICLLSISLAAAKGQDDLQIKISLSKEKVWQREQVTISLTIITKDTLARLASDDFEQNGFSIITLDQEGVEKEGKLHIKKEWIVYPFLAGEQLIKLPRIRYRPNSGRPITLELPQKILTVLRLPIYVSPTMPVGKIELESDWKHGRVIAANTLYQWQISAKVKQVAPQTMPAISRLLRSSESLQVLPIKTKILTSEALISDNDMVSSRTEGDVFKQIIYQVPIKAIGFGQLELPEVAIQYFDPNSGKLKKTRLKYPYILVINQWLIGLAVIALLTGCIFIIRKTLPNLQALNLKRKLKREALSSLASANNYQEIRNALYLYAKAMGWGENITLDQFAQNLNIKPFHKEIGTIIEKLRGAEFSLNDKYDQEVKKQASALYTLLE